MKNVMRAASISVALASAVALGAPAAHANTNDPLYISRDGDLKAMATWVANGTVCASLEKGSIVTVAINGQHVNDYAADGVPNCQKVNVTLGVVYNWRMTWQGTNGAILDSAGTVKRTLNN